MNLLSRGYGVRAVSQYFGVLNRKAMQQNGSTHNKLFRVSEEVQNALQTGKPVVALESTIYTHGFPYPENVALATQLESLVRTHGGVPATIGLIDGVAHVGLSHDMLVQLVSKAGNKETIKVSRRDLAYLGGLGLRGKKLNGGTTISGTMVLAHLAGIKVFATGGLGGVHKGGETTMDISADLTELGRTPVAVVSSGSKSFLDIPRTLEYLETQGVGIATFADGRDGDVDFPGFFSRDSGVKSPRTIQDEADAAAIIHAQFSLPVNSGLLFGNPVPTEFALSKTEIDLVMAQAVREADEQGISGWANTPFVLKRIKELTNNGTVAANQALIEANIIRGTKVAVELAKLELEEKSGAWSGMTATPQKEKMSMSLNESDNASKAEDNKIISSISEEVDLLVIGALAYDTMCDYAPFKGSGNSASPTLHTSNPSKTSQSSGGVGRNVAMAAHLAGARVSLASAVADDIAGTALLEQLSGAGLPTSSIMLLKTSDGARTAQYVAVNDLNKDLVLAMGDFAIFDRPEFHNTDIWSKILKANRPKWIVIDGNWSESTTVSVLQAAKLLKIPVAFEPVSTVKAARVFHAASQVLSSSSVIPNHVLNLATPNKMELSAMHKAAQDSHLLESEQWWFAIDKFSLSNSGSREKLAMMTSPNLVDEGVPQQCIQLLPFVPNLITKLGPKGCLLASVLRKGDERLTSPEAAPYTLSRNMDENSPIGGIYLRLFPPEEQIEQSEIVSVNGVGDTLLGVLMAGIIADIRMGVSPRLENIIPTAQNAAILTLKSAESVSPDVIHLRRERSHHK